MGTNPEEENDWVWISIYQVLSEEFIERHIGKIHWRNISQYQVLSEGFIERHSFRINWKYVSKYQKFSIEFIGKYNIDVPETCWLYKTGKFLKERIEELNLYECHEEYFIAFKGIRRERYSKFNFQFQYLKGETYESNCDCNIDEANSFGVSIWAERVLEDIVQKW